jgi:uncharacterized cupredoxin-like copper-binding protein
MPVFFTTPARAGLIAGLLGLATAPLAHAGPGAKFPFGGPANPAQAGRTVTITVGDNFYEPETVAVKAGETVRFVIVNQGDLLHEFALGRPRDHVAHQEMMTMMVEHGMITATKINRETMNMQMGGGTHAHGAESASVLVEPGRQDELVWKFTAAMTLEFACTIPGHYESGMVGTFDFTR